VGNDVTVTEAITTVSSSGVDTDVSVSAESTTVEVAGADQIILNQQATEVTVGYTTTTVEINENATQLSVVSPHYSAEIPFSTDVSVPYLSKFKSENVTGGITNSFSLGLADTGSTSTTTLQTTGTNPTFNLNSSTINLDGQSISIDANNLLELRGDTTDIYCQLASLKLGEEKTFVGQDTGARIASAGTPYTGLFVVENTTRPFEATSRCPFIIIEGKTNNATYPSGTTKEFLHIGIDNTGGSNYSNRVPTIINPDGFGLRLAYSGNSSFSGLHPIDENASLDDNAHSLGQQYARWAKIYLASNPIVGSDRSLKQDIEDLNDAERRVAVVCKGLLKKYKYRQSVEEKGENARIHFGIIAQDLQQAFIDEGLDPAKYAVFCSDTWYEHDGQKYTDRSEAPSDATEVTQLGVRYEQLLAFIIASI